MSGYASFSDFSMSSVLDIPCIDATIDTTRTFGKFIDRDKFQTTPVTYKKMIDSITGRELIIPKKEAVGKFEVWQHNGYSYAINQAVDSGLYTVAKVHYNNPYKFYFREVNYHPECSQLVIPEEPSPFILILGNDTDNLKALIFDGSKGFEIYPGVWHQPPVLHYKGRLVFDNKQAVSHICVLYDSVKESKKWLSFTYA